MNSNIIVFFLFSLVHSEVTKSENLRKTFNGFFFTMPKTLLSGRNETVCLSIHHTPISTVEATVDLKIREKHFFTMHKSDSEQFCFEMRVPQHNNKEPQFARIRVEIKINNIQYSGHNQDPVVIYPNKKITFIDTDRRSYKAEDIVKLRILILKENLLPPRHYSIPHVRIKNPLGVNVFLWENVTTEFGLAQMEYQLSRYTVEGKWLIEANGETKSFEVSKYVLPRFKVFITHPKIIYYDVSSVSMKVCAKYSYGGIVKGTAFIRLRDTFNNFKNIQSIQNMTDGCGDFHFSKIELSYYSMRNKFPLVDTKISVIITATVLEYGTDKIQLATSKMFVSLKPYTMKFLQNDIFLPGLPYYGSLQFNNINIDMDGEVIEICYNTAIRKSWNYLKNEQCSNFTLTDEKLIQFHILPFKSNVIHMQLSARSLNHSNVVDTLLVVRLYSPSGTYIRVDPINSNGIAKCRDVQQFSVQYTAEKLKEHENITFYYMIKSRQQIYKMRKVIHNVHKHYPNYLNDYKSIVGLNNSYTKLGNSVSKFILKFRLDERIISNYQLLVYYISPEGELISASREITVENCLYNEVKANWSHKQIHPGGTAALLVETKSDSLCSVTSIDKATQFMDGGHSETIKSILKPFLIEREVPDSRRKACVISSKKSREDSNILKNETSSRRKRYVYDFSEDYDAYDVIDKFGVITITNFKVITKPCYTGPLPTSSNSVQSLTEYDVQTDDQTQTIRSYFPETWIWELVPVRGAAVIHRTLPHSTTSWITNVLCVSGSNGVGISEPTEITSFQPFFVDVLTPFSIKKGENLYLQTVVFNYLTYNIPVRISLTASEGLALIEPLTKRSFSYCVSSNDTVIHMFEMKAYRIGKANVTVMAELDSSYPGHCGPDIVINKRDVVFKSLIIEPEGYSVQVVKSALLCGSGFVDEKILTNVTWDLQEPKDVVIGTLKMEVIFNGDILGQAIENFDDLITMPTGCGEQIMASLAPNVYILKYLNTTKNLTPSLRRKILRNLKIGYQKILNYIHKDGSFSAFGYHDPMGSMFLTAFVVRTLQDIKQYIYIDQKIVDRAVAWILNHQLENGCFSTMLHVFQDMGGTTFENSTAGLTAYVIISLLESKIEISETVKTNAKYCIRGHFNFDKYTLAISSYALLKVDWNTEANRLLKKLFQLSNEKDNMLWWTSKTNDVSIASDIETTSYVLLALLHEQSQENLAKAHSVVQWLSSQQGPRGGFKSTQDTVVGLYALTKYNEFVNRKKINLNVDIKTDDHKHEFKMDEKSRFKTNKIVLKNMSKSVKINVHGDGCILAQTLISYYTKEISTHKMFNLDMEVLPVSNIDECSVAKLSSCLTYKGPENQSSMTILEVDLPSGYEVDKVSLYRLIDEDKTTKVKMFEELQNKVVLYMTKLESQPNCVNFNINKNAVVHSKMNSTVKLYEYYKPEYSVVQFYKINDKCKFRSSILPDISGNFSANNMTNARINN